MWRLVGICCEIELYYHPCPKEVALPRTCLLNKKKYPKQHNAMRGNPKFICFKDHIGELFHMHQLKQDFV